MVRGILLLGLITLVSAENRIEEQRKYSPTISTVFPQERFLVGDFRFHPHDLYYATDIYFDDKGERLSQAGLGLRLRKVQKGKLDPQYVLQLKTEMALPGAARIEEEDRDLSLQKIEGVSIISIVDRISENKKITDLDARLLNAWMSRKADSSLAPFQELRRRKISAKDLAPVVFGLSKRQRYHILVDRKEKISELIMLKDSEKNPLLIPAIFSSNSPWIWLMEASWDDSHFYNRNGEGEPLVIQELEIENKYRPREMGTKLMNKLEAELIPRFNFTLGRESKFIRAYKHFKEQVP